MSYTSPNELLSDRAHDVIKGLDDLNGAMENRLQNSSEWKENHLADLEQYQLEILKFRHLMTKIKRNNR